MDTLAKVLEALGFELIVQTSFGRDLPMDEKREQLRDRGGRHFPAHHIAGLWEDAT